MPVPVLQLFRHLPDRLQFPSTYIVTTIFQAAWSGWHWISKRVDGIQAFNRPKKISDRGHRGKDSTQDWNQPGGNWVGFQKGQVVVREGDRRVVQMREEATRIKEFIYCRPNLAREFAGIENHCAGSIGRKDWLRTWRRGRSRRLGRCGGC